MFDDGLFDLFSEPVLLLRDGRIAACSAGARAMGLAVGADAPTLPDIPSGGASLELTLAGRPRTVTARPLEDGMLLLVQPEQTELLSAQTLLAVSHALQTPLEELFSAGETLVPVLEELEDSSLQHSTAVCQRALYRLGRLCGHLRDFGGGLSGELALRREKTELCSYFGDLCEQLESLCAELGVSLREKLPARQFYGWIDRKRLGSAICELLSNALKYTPCGGSILLELTRHEQNAVITIADSGEGMDGETLAERFRNSAALPRWTTGGAARASACRSCGRSSSSTAARCSCRGAQRARQSVFCSRFPHQAKNSSVCTAPSLCRRMARRTPR